MGTISLQGAPELIAALAEISTQLERKVVAQATRQGAKEFAEATRQEAPRGLTGELAKGPKVRAGKRKKGWISYNARYARTDEDKFYAIAVDQGAKRSGKGHKATIPPQYFMERAFQKTAPTLEIKLPQIMADKLDAVVKQANKSK